MALGRCFGEPEQREQDQKIGQEVVIRAYLHTVTYRKGHQKEYELKSKKQKT